ncbi:hypothetical protein [Sulfobacillus harzensis]|uniref:Uncharacterized protein n=1 Tax=Sulfobacillus harzensis TaxID=2729629 RepID=A0A7Y0L001_9FIRM|nr:hypothetical protein [Sulfobacillus harzensis]NMP20819.1 hypothetical protein [Sulfobacillus harzensis]
MNMPSFGWGGSTRGLGTLIAVIMRYPEVSSVQCAPEAKTISVTFVVRGIVDDEAWERVKDDVVTALASYRQMTRRPLNSIDLNREPAAGVTTLELMRDTDTVSVEEIGIAIEILRDQADLTVLFDPHDLLEEDMMVQEETIQERLLALIEEGSGRLVALRDEGRVLIFNT